MQLQKTNVTEHPEEYQSQEEIKQLEKCIFAFCYGGSPLLHGCKLAKFWLPPHQAIFSSLRRADLNGRKSNSAAAFYFWKWNSQISSQNKPTPILMTLWIEQNRLLLLALFRLSVGGWEAREHYTKTPQVSLRAQTCTYPIFGHWPLPAQFSLGHPHSIKAAEFFHLLDEIADPQFSQDPSHNSRWICVICSHNQAPSNIRVPHLQDEKYWRRKFGKTWPWLWCWIYYMNK